MMRSVAFLGGINVGGHRVKMDRLKELFEAAKLKNVTTYIASGNVLFDHASSLDAAKLEAKLEQHLEAALGFPVPTYLRTLQEVAGAVAANPLELLPDHALHVCFLRRALTAPETAVLKEYESDAERLAVHGRQLYWRCAGGASQTKINWRQLARRINTASTARNINMLQKLLATSAG